MHISNTIIKEQFVEILKPKFDGSPYDVLNREIAYICENYIGKRNRAGEFFFINEMNCVISLFALTQPAHWMAYRSEFYNKNCKYNKRKRKKLRLGEYRSYKRFYFRKNEDPSRIDVYDSYRIFDELLRCRRQNKK